MLWTQFKFKPIRFKSSSTIEELLALHQLRAMFREMFSSSNGFEAKAGCFGKRNFYLIMCGGGLGDLLTLNCEIGIKLDGLVTLPSPPSMDITLPWDKICTSLIINHCVHPYQLQLQLLRIVEPFIKVHFYTAARPKRSQLNFEDQHLPKIQTWSNLCVHSTHELKVVISRTESAKSTKKNR